MSPRGTDRGFRRTLITGGLALAALFGSMATPGQASPGSATAPAQEPYIDQGRASGRGNVLSVAPSAGTLQFAVGSGEVIAETTGGLAQAQASTADLGIIGSSLTSEKCDGTDPSFREDQIPHPLVIDNRSGPASAEEAEAPTGVPGASGGRKQAEATDTPSSRATATALAVELPGLLTVNGGQAVAEAEVFPGAGREARSFVDADLVIAGAVELRGVQWSARHRTGGEDGAEGAFTFEALEIAGVPVPADDMEAAEAAINQALGAIGLRVEMPEVVRVQEGNVDFVRVTPLRLVLADSPVSELVVRPALEATQELRAQMFDALVAITCRFSEILLVGEIGIGVLAGTGQLTASIGGVEASSADVVIENLFGGGGAVGPVLGSTPEVGSGALGGGDSTPAVAGSGAVPPPAGGSVSAAPAGATGPFDRICENIHPNRKPSCSDGAAGVVGVVGLAATAAVGALDLHRRRRALVAAAGVAT